MLQTYDSERSSGMNDVIAVEFIGQKKNLEHFSTYSFLRVQPFLLHRI
jgi:hypothetical protein